MKQQQHDIHDIHLVTAFNMHREGTEILTENYMI